MKTPALAEILAASSLEIEGIERAAAEIGRKIKKLDELEAEAMAESAARLAAAKAAKEGAPWKCLYCGARQIARGRTRERLYCSVRCARSAENRRNYRKKVMRRLGEIQGN